MDKTKLPFEIVFGLASCTLSAVILQTFLPLPPALAVKALIAASCLLTVYRIWRGQDLKLSLIRGVTMAVGWCLGIFLAIR